MLEQFLIFLTTERRVSKHTLTAYQNDIQSFLDFVEVIHEKELTEISYQNIRSWMVHLMGTKHSNRSVNRKLSALRTFFKWAKQMEWVKIDPMQKIRGPKQEKRLPEFVKEEEIKEEKMDAVFPATFEGERDRLLIEVLYQTGIRLSELINLKQQDINNHTIKVLGKRNKERIIPISQELENHILQYLSCETYLRFDNEFVFLTDKGKKMYPNFVYRKVKYYLSLLTHLKKRSPHILRHTFATHMLNNGAGLEILKEILGHANLSATQIYTHNSFEELSKIYKQAHPRGD